MVTIHFITTKYAQLYMDRRGIETKANTLLKERSCHFEMKFLDVSEDEFLKGDRTGAIELKVIEQNNPNPIIEDVFLYLEPFASTSPHLHNSRYVSFLNHNTHFLAVWSDRLNNYCEFFIQNLSNKTITRFIP